MTPAVAIPTDVRAFTIDTTAAQVDDLRRRIAATRWPTGELVRIVRRG